MTTVIDFNEAEVAEPLDFSNIGVYARAADQGIIGGAIAYPNNWARFSIAQPNSFTLTINPGLLFVDNVVYDCNTALNVNLQTYLPLVSGHQKWVLLLLQGRHEVVNGSRMVETDSETGETVLQSVPKTDRLYVQPIVSDGLPAPVPIKPVVPANECCLAYVLLSSTGIVSIEPGEKWRVKTLSELDTRVTQLEGEIVFIKQRTAQLETDVAWLAGQLRSIPRPEIVEQMKRNIAAINRKVGMPDEARAFWYDPGLVMDHWDATHVNWLARVREGVRFPYAQIVDSQMALLNPGDTKLRITNELVLPAWTEKTRIAVEGNDGSKDISQQQHTVTDVIERTVSGVSISYGPTVTICENANEWSSIKGAHQGETFSVNGVEYISDGLTKNTENVPGHNSSPAQWNADPASAGHKNYDVRQLQYESWSQTYWDYIVKVYGVNGSIYAQTFLNSQQMIMTSIDVNFTRVGSDGDVHMYLCELNSSAEPDYKTRWLLRPSPDRSWRLAGTSSRSRRRCWTPASDMHGSP